ncbi:MAG: hypothetical protein ACK4TN_02735 [Brevinematales bacterium]
MPWYQVDLKSITWKRVVVFFVLWGIFFVGIILMMYLSRISYRLCEVRYVIDTPLPLYGREEEFTEEAINLRLQRERGMELKVAIRVTNISIFSPTKILTIEEISSLDRYLRTNFSHVRWYGPEVRVVPQLQAEKRWVLYGILSLSMALGVMVAWLLRREP